MSPPFCALLRTCSEGRDLTFPASLSSLAVPNPRAAAAPGAKGTGGGGAEEGGGSGGGAKAAAKYDDDVWSKETDYYD